ncbi:MAG: transporter [Micavibrio sp.]
MGALSAGGLIGSLSTATTLVKTLDSAFSALQGFSGGAESDQRAALRAQHDLALRQLQAQQGLADSNANAAADLNKQKLAADSAQADRNRRDALRRAIARQNAQIGAQGFSSSEGSGEAVLLGLFEESENERAARDKIDTLRTRAIDQDREEQSRINVLQRTQLQERQQLQRALADY